MELLFVGHIWSVSIYKISESSGVGITCLIELSFHVSITGSICSLGLTNSDNNRGLTEAENLEISLQREFLAQTVETLHKELLLGPATDKK